MRPLLFLSLDGYLHDYSRVARYMELGGGIGGEGEGDGGAGEELGGFDIF